MEPEFLQNMRKRKGHAEFACFVRNHTRRPISLTVPFGQMEKQEKLANDEFEKVLADNRRRYSSSGTAVERVASEKEALGHADLL